VPSVLLRIETSSLSLASPIEGKRRILLELDGFGAECHTERLTRLNAGKRGDGFAAFLAIKNAAPAGERALRNASINSTAI
jgi:hypothetical protein